jgi:hypothetical protein
MCSAQAKLAEISSKRRFVLGKKIGSFWVTIALISASNPQIFGKSERVPAGVDGLLDDAAAIMNFPQYSLFCGTLHPT